eukprot:TRINITY_DN5153_c0_g2_i1.p1 TRINITY_DN5153_c0_g2~~TRINITY_DN5153_c0_g2_i1.p1  ORF type:complete len:304 (-),score=49.13 TRINITY_DN5153_c0_g2_i1:143-1054(-)
MSETLRRALSSLMEKVAAISSVDALPEVESLDSEPLDADDISPDDSVSCVDCDDAWLALLGDIDDVRPEDSISNVCVPDPAYRACDLGEHGILSKKSDTNNFDDADVLQSNKNSSARDEATMDTWKRSSRRYVSWRATVGHPDREQHVPGSDGVEAVSQNLKSSSEVSASVDDECPEDAVRISGLGADNESTDKRDLTLNSDRNPVKHVAFKCSKWNPGFDDDEHLDISTHLQSQPVSSVLVAGKSTRGDLPAKCSAKLDARERHDDFSFGISTTASSECDEVPDANDDDCVPVTSAEMQRCC